MKVGASHFLFCEQKLNGVEDMFKGDLLRYIEAIHRDKGIDKELIFQGIESALLSAAKKRFGTRDTTVIRIDRETGEVVATDQGREIDPVELGRIAAQTAKQVMMQKIREAERDALLLEYGSKLGDILNGSVSRFEGRSIIVNLGKTEGVLPRSEQVPGENYRIGDRIRAMLLEAKKKGSRVRLILTRAHSEFVRRLFELEVPEIAEGVIQVRALVREPGYRTKITVDSTNDRVDAVGACVGVRGSRIKNIVEELGGEKVDIIRFDPDELAFIQNALKPAEVHDLIIDSPDEKRARVVVTRDRLSLAIGKGGQNVRLASKLTGWELDIACAEDLEQEEAEGEAAAEDEAEAAAELAAAPAPEGETTPAESKEPAPPPEEPSAEPQAEPPSDAAPEEGPVAETPKQPTE